MHNHCINKLLNIEEVIVKKVVHTDNFVKFYLETKSKEHPCPACGTLTKRIHDYRVQTIKDLPFQEKHCYLVLKKCRYACSCGKRFYENYRFLPRYFQRSSRLTAFLAASLNDTVSLDYVAKRCNVSASTDLRILVDPLKHSLLDILPSRSQTFLASYFRSIKRQNVTG